MSQESRLWELLKDGKPHRTDEIVRVVYGINGPTICRISARINDIKKKHGVRIDCWMDKHDHAFWWYQFLPASSNPPKVAVDSRARQGVLFVVKPKERNQWD